MRRVLRVRCHVVDRQLMLPGDFERKKERPGALLQRMRRARRVKQKELADILGVSQSCLSAWETGRNKPSVDMIEKISKKLLIDKTELFQSFLDD